jgi:hypothetical protein
MIKIATNGESDVMVVDIGKPAKVTLTLFIDLGYTSGEEYVLLKLSSGVPRTRPQHDMRGIRKLFARGEYL